MDMRKIYKKNDEFIKGRWLRILISILVIAAITSALSMALGGANSMFSIEDLFMPNEYDYYGMYDYNPTPIVHLFSKTAGIALLVSFVKDILNFSLAIELKDNYETDCDVRLDSTARNVKKHGVKLFLVSLIKTVINGLIAALFVLIIFVIVMLVGSFGINSYDSGMYDPYYNTGFDLGGIIALLLLVGLTVMLVGMLYVEYGFAYSIFLISEDEELDVLDAVKNSFTQTKGHKFNLFRSHFRYGIRIVGLFIISFILSIIFIGIGAESFGAFIVTIGVVSTLVLSVYYLPHTTTINGVYYIEMHRKLISDMNKEIEPVVANEIKLDEEVETVVVSDEILEPAVDIEPAVEIEPEEIGDIESEDDTVDETIESNTKE